MPKILEDPENPRCQNVFRCYGFHIADLDFTGNTLVKAKDKEHAKHIVDNLLNKRGLMPYEKWLYTIVEVGEITPPEKL